MKKGLAGQLLVDMLLPEDMRQPGRILDKKTMAKLLSELAQKHPDQYRNVLHDLMHVSHQAAYWTGGASFGLQHLQVARGVLPLRQHLDREVRAVWADPKLTTDQKEKKVLLATQKLQTEIENAVYDESVREKNPLARQIVSGARGNKANLSTLRGTDLLYIDHHNRPIPIPILRSYSEGLRPHEYYASTFGARKGLAETKLSVADTGYLNKQFNQATHRLLVTSLDAAEHDGNVRGMPVATDDLHNEGALLAQDRGGYPRNTLLTPKILGDLLHKGHQRILVRSPTVGGPADGGVYARDVGVRERGRIAPVGDFVGIAAGQALAETVTQMSLSAKHSGGASGATSNLATGFPAIDQLVQVPKIYQGGAAHAQLDGQVRSVEEAPQGGVYVTIDDKRHYVAQGLDVLVKPGDTLEAGDVLSEGTPNPALVVEHKGLGEGRRYFVETLRDAYKRSGVTPHRRNLELLSRGLINHVRMVGEMGFHAPGDVVPYSRLEHYYEPREDHLVVEPRSAKGKYLEQPVLHYSIGTRVRPSVIKTLEEFGIKQIPVHHEPPPFVPEMVRGLETLSSDPDWMTRFLGSYVKKNLLRGAHRGDVSDERGTSYVPSLARAVEFNQFPPVKGYEPPAPPDMTHPAKKPSLLTGLLPPATVTLVG